MIIENRIHLNGGFDYGCKNKEAFYFFSDNNTELSESSWFQLNYATVATTKQMIAQTMMKAKSAKVTFFKMPALVFSLFLP